MTADPGVAIVAGVGPGLGQALCRQLLSDGYRVAAIARGTAATEALRRAVDAERFMAVQCDLGEAGEVDRAIGEVETRWAAPAVYVHNAAAFLREPFLETPPERFTALWRSTCLGAVLGARRALPGMLAAGRGVLLLIGATASVKAGAQFAAFASAKFALRGLAQSLARELGPQGIHVAHLVIDGVIWSDRARDELALPREGCLDPDALARTCAHLIAQERSAWTLELDIRPDREGF